MFSRVDNVHHNKSNIKKQNCPIASNVVKTIRSKYYVKIDEDDMKLELVIAIGDRVMLTSNIWTNAGVVNSALGVVE